MEFLEEVLYESREIWEKGKHHPFVLELYKGTLPLEKFRYYLVQDWMYLADYQRIHELGAKRSADPVVKELLLAGAASIKEEELSVRREIFAQLDIQPDTYLSEKMAPATYHYTSHLYRAFYDEPLEVAISALLPCYWLYQAIGEEITLEAEQDVPVYKEWIASYQDPAFTQVTNQMKMLVTQSAASVPEGTRKKMKEAFYISCQEEYQFWQMAYGLKTWA